MFGIPGAKIDKVFDSLLDSSIRIIPVRHEANAAFMAAAVGRITGKGGRRAGHVRPRLLQPDYRHGHRKHSEGDPVVALGGAVKRADKAKQVHQSMDTVAMFSPVTKYSVEVTAAEALAEVVSNAFRAAEQGRPGSAFVSLPQDVVDEPVHARVLPPAMRRRPARRRTKPLSESRR
ncbi:acetolactate synthase [Klebsiella michiganensis]|uniref:Acetolactate synthase n=1 Tax=Klebsiella michiganensis TaxID=1134687 RepID=A0A7H4MXN1_9ENTR|nr:acetolactate synthase [Klebsiella michiganensis]